MPRLSRQQSQEITRERLRRSALDAFARNGVAGTGIETIAKGAGYSRGAFYANYGSKLELLTDILKNKQVNEVRYWRQAMEDAENVDASLEAMAADFGKRAMSKDSSLLTAELQLEADRNKDFRPLFQAYLDKLFEEIRSFFVVLLARHGKAPPENMNAVLITVRALTFALGSSSVLGSETGRQQPPENIMLAFLRKVIADAPPLK